MPELREGFSRRQLVEIVDDQHDWSELLSDLGHDSLDQLVGVERTDRVRRAADRVEDGPPEPLRVTLVAVHGHKRDAAKFPRAVSPRTQQRGLPASRRRRDDRDPFGYGAIQPLKKFFPVE